VKINYSDIIGYRGTGEHEGEHLCARCAGTTSRVYSGIMEDLTVEQVIAGDELAEETGLLVCDQCKRILNPPEKPEEGKP